MVLEGEPRITRGFCSYGPELTPQPASGVVHEIVGQWYAGKGELEPSA